MSHSYSYVKASDVRRITRWRTSPLCHWTDYCSYQVTLICLVYTPLMH